MRYLSRSVVFAFIATLVTLSGCNAGDSNENVEVIPASDVSVDVVESRAGEMPFKASTTEITVVSMVTAIDHQTREVTLLGDDGIEHSFIASEDARNLGQVSVGDKVTVKYLENFTIQVVDGKNVIPTTSSVSSAIRSEKGEMPAGAVGTKKTEVFIVEEINLEANTFKLKNAKGAIKEFESKNPENLKASSVGDAVVLSSVNTVAVEVTKAGSE